MSVEVVPLNTSRIVRHGFESVPVPVGAAWPFAASTNLKPVVVTLMVHVAETVRAAVSRTVMVGDAVDCGFGQEISPVLALIVIPDGAFVSE